MTDISSIDITYQDGLRLSELYGQMGTIQYDLAHLSMSVIGYTVVICILVALVYFFIMSVWMKNIKWDVFYYDRYIPSDYQSPWVWKKRGKYAFYALVAGVILLYIVMCIVIQVGCEHIMEYYLNRDMANIQAQVDAILQRYGVS